ncbi:hypothetical protein PVAP13_4NG201499 [Panicum virgatum]|uniref:Uncharacterized protein n=1 Tax=Panicum virgatum TaxID=38727 RepID=A0A8T0TCX7_PANVG|nr:hypothetical protein PVAP13_4NG201499 [Panicum virgatum]
MLRFRVPMARWVSDGGHGSENFLQCRGTIWRAPRRFTVARGWRRHCRLDAARCGSVGSWLPRLPGRSFGDATEQESPIRTSGMTQFFMTSAASISACSIVGSTMSWIFSGNALSTKPCSTSAKIFCLLLLANPEQRGIPSVGTLVHKCSFPSMDMAPALSKIPSLGTAPLKLLKDKLRCCRELKDARNSGISPDNLFREISISLMLTKFMKDCGMLPAK